MIPIALDWREVMAEFRRRGLTDQEITRRLVELGVKIDNSTLCYLRGGRIKMPRYALGAGLLNVLSAQ